MIFVRDVRKLMVVFSSVIGTHFLVGFIALVFVYRFMIKSIRKMRVTVQSMHTTCHIVLCIPFAYFNSSHCSFYNRLVANKVMANPLMV